ncbi:hypothetical protein SAMN06309944_1536 [Micrococcales bacterium KH10]|nr:hypothetical protein SAMN06309944_1536 [Micrococcales bacterium KH10]
MNLPRRSSLTRTRHFLITGSDVGTDEVFILADAAFRGAQFATDAQRLGELVPECDPSAATGAEAVVALSRHSALVQLPQTPRNRPGLSDEAISRIAPDHRWYAIDTLVERDDDVPVTAGDRDGLIRVMRGSWPKREELRVIQWLIAAARRLHGAVLLDVRGDADQPRYELIEPDPAAEPDLTIYSPVWLTPAAAEVLCQQVFPQARLGSTNHAWAGPPSQDIPSQPALDGVQGRVAGSEDEFSLDEATLAQIHDAVDEEDLTVLRDDPKVSGYAIVVPVPVPVAVRDDSVADDPYVSVEVGAAEIIPAVLRHDEELQRGCVQYRLAWEPSDIAGAHRERLSDTLLYERAEAARIIAAWAAALHEACGGYLVDAHGFAVDPQYLQ